MIFIELACISDPVEFCPRGYMPLHRAVYE